MSQYTVEDFVPNIKEVFEGRAPLALGRNISIVNDNGAVSYSNYDKSMPLTAEGQYRNKVLISSVKDLPLIYLYAGLSRDSYGVNVALQVSNNEEPVKRKIRTRIPTIDAPKLLNCLDKAIDISYILDRIDRFTIYGVDDCYRRAVYVDVYNENDAEKYEEFIHGAICYREITDIVLEVIKNHGEEYVNVTLYTDYNAYTIDSLIDIDNMRIRSYFEDIVKYFDTDTDLVLDCDLIHYRNMFG